MKKRYLLVGFIVLWLQNLSAQIPVSLKGEITGLGDTTMVYVKNIFTGVTIDSVRSEKDHFFMNLDLPEANACMLMLGNGRPADYNVKPVFLDKGDFIIKGNGPLFKEVSFSGSKSANDFNDFEKQMTSLNASLQELQKKYMAARLKQDTAIMKNLETEFNRFDSLSRIEATTWLATHQKSNFASYILLFYLRPASGKLAELEPQFMQLSDGAKTNALGKRIQGSIDATKKLAIGKAAPLFTQNDTLGNPVSLASFKGKYVLVDFWASWCKPCRIENPVVVKSYIKFNQKNYTVLSVSLDQPGEKNKWMQAIHDDRLTWTHVSDLKFWENEVAKQYDIQSIPANFLVDPEGVIVARDLHGDELEKKLTELLGAARR